MALAVFWIIAQYALPAGTDVMFNTLHYSPAALRAVCITSQESRDPARPAFKTMILDVPKCSATDLAGLFKDLPERAVINPVDISPDGLSEILHVISRDGASLWVLELKTLKLTKVAEGQILGSCWFGGKAAVSKATDDGGVEKIQLVDPAGGKPVELPVRGVVAVAGGKPEMLIVAGNPKAPADKITVEAVEAGALFSIDAHGKVVRVLSPGHVVSSRPVLSPNGGWLAFQSKPSREVEPSDVGYSVTVLSTDGKDKWTLKDPAGEPAAVLDDGRVVATASVQGPDGTTLMLCDAKGNKADLGKAAGATLVGDTLYVATKGLEPAIKLIQFQPPKAK